MKKKTNKQTKMGKEEWQKTDMQNRQMFQMLLKQQAEEKESKPYDMEYVKNYAQAYMDSQEAEKEQLKKRKIRRAIRNGEPIPTFDDENDNENQNENNQQNMNGIPPQAGMQGMPDMSNINMQGMPGGAGPDGGPPRKSQQAKPEDLPPGFQEQIKQKIEMEKLKQKLAKEREL